MAEWALSTWRPGTTATIRRRPRSNSSSGAWIPMSCCGGSGRSARSWPIWSTPSSRAFWGGATDDGLPYFVMEYVDGLPITKYCDEHKLELAERLRLFRLVCEAAQYAHQNLVVHRD